MGIACSSPDMRDWNLERVEKLHLHYIEEMYDFGVDRDTFEVCLSGFKENLAGELWHAFDPTNSML